MKKIIPIFLMMQAFATSLSAQDTTAIKDDKLTLPISYVVMKNSKLLWMKNGNLTTLDKDLTLPNGTVVFANGAVKAANGITMQLQEGDRLDMDGKLIMKSDKWQTDSTAIHVDSTFQKF